MTWYSKECTGALTFESFGQFLCILAPFVSGCYFFANAFSELVIFSLEFRGNDRRIAPVLYGISRCACVSVCVSVDGRGWVSVGVGVGLAWVWV